MNFGNHSSRDGSSDDKNDKVGATPGKLLLVAVLGVVLVVSAVINFGGSSPAAGSPSNTSKRKPKLPNRNRTGSKTRNVSAKGKSNAQPKRIARGVDWPKLAVSEAVAFDPFAKPDFLKPPPPPPAAEPEPEPEPEPVDPGPSSEELQLIADEKAQESMRRVVVSLADLGITMIMSSPTGAVAQVGGRELRVGDTIEGLVVTRIDMDGIELALPAKTKGASDGN